jgi:MoaA/NifB/PqqE/SkfB family radical SAM enzyme
MLLTEEISDDLLSMKGLKQFCVSFDAVTPEVFDAIRVHARYDRVYKNFKYFCKKKKELNRDDVTVGIAFTALRQNIEDLPKLVELAHEWGINLIYVAYAFISGTSDANWSLYFSQDLTNRIFDEATELGERLGVGVHLPSRFGQTEKQEWRKCSWAWNSVYLHPNGIVGPCCVIQYFTQTDDNRHLTDKRENSLTEKSFKEIWNGKDFIKLRKTVNEPDAFYPHCRHSCPVFGRGEAAELQKHFDPSLYPDEESIRSLAGTRDNDGVSQQSKKENLKRYFHSLKEKEMIVSSTPLEIFAEVSNRCNINCKMCSLHDSDREKGVIMSLELMKKLSSFLNDAYILHAHGFGEPLLNRDIGYLIESAKSNGVSVDFFTNGMLLNPERSERFVKSGVDEITLSLDGARKETVEWVREGVKFDILERNINHLKAMKDGIIKLEIKPLVVYDHLPMMKQYIKYFDPEKDGDLMNRVKSKAADYGIEFYSFLQTIDKNSDERPVSVEEPAGPPEPGFFCWYPFRTMYVRADGYIKPCCFYWDQTYLGNISTADIREVWNGEGYREIRSQCRDGIIPDGCRWCIKNSLRPPVDNAEHFDS